MTINIKRTNGLAESLAALTRKGAPKEAALPPHVVARNTEIFGEVLTAHQVVERIVEDVRANGDVAVRKYTKAYDGRDVAEFEIPRSEWDAALQRIDPNLRAALELTAARVRSFHEKQKRESWFNADENGIFGQVIRPLERVGIYTPGGSAALPSSLLMTAVPARVAGVEEIIIAAPPRGDESVPDIILAAAAIANVDRVFAIGGAQAIAALAYGTESVPQVDKICGPGNLFVALAKQRVNGVVAIDAVAGPTETLVIADDSANIELVAADLIAQAEHDAVASAILITTSPSIADGVVAEIEAQATLLPRLEVITASLDANGVIALVDSLDDAITCGNAYAPEHMCLEVADAWSLVPQIRNAGGIFVGENSPEAMGDYSAGPSHVMPTMGTARFSSPANVNDYQKIISLFAASDTAVQNLGPSTVTFAQAEGLDGHAASIQRRLKAKKD
ncbi:MAG: histidinol dehydrogenase [Thermomicrobiales bacterium]|nr:histidinol dehydrogenase [Thermomicrobiales bacterium]